MTTNDPLAPLADLPGVAEAGEEAREALGRAHRHRTNLRGWPMTAAEAALRAARASAVPNGASVSSSPWATAASTGAGTADGVVARAVSRLVTIASGLDPHGLGVPEVFWLRHSGDYRAAARGFASGTPDGLAVWLVLSSRAMHAGAREALSIAAAAAS